MTTNNTPTQYINAVVPPYARNGIIGGSIAFLTPNLEFYNGTSWIRLATIFDLTSKANIDSPNFTGTPILPSGTVATTQSIGDNTTKVATTSFVSAAVAAANAPQVLSLGSTAGNIALSGSGGTVDLKSISVTSFQNADVLPTSSGIFPYTTTTGALNYPTAIGGGVKIMRAASSGIGYIDIFKAGSSGQELYFRTGITATTFTGWRIIADQTWVTNLLITPEYADNAAAIAGGLSIGKFYRTGDTVKVVH
jgi:CO/xanthine dehydrogenase FAD-binding subunit